MHSFDFQAFVFDGEINCLDCGEYDSENEEMTPIFADSEWDSYPCCAACGEQFTYVNLTSRGKLEETGHEVIASLARTAFCLAWADLQEELGDDGINLSGCRIEDHAPETTPEALAFAYAAARSLATRNGLDGSPASAMGVLFDRACKADRAASKSLGTADEFGSGLALMVQGHGVSWFDDHAKFPLVTPHCEFKVRSIDELR